MIVTPELAALIVAKNKAEAMTTPDSLAVIVAEMRLGDLTCNLWADRIATLEAAPAPNAWKDAVLDALASTCQDAPIGASPADILQRVISFHVAVATDSRVSDSAHDPVWADEAMALHWIERFAAGVDDEPQMDRILDCVFRPAPPAPADGLAKIASDLAARQEPLGAEFDAVMSARLEDFLDAPNAPAPAGNQFGPLTDEEMGAPDRLPRNRLNAPAPAGIAPAVAGDADEYATTCEYVADGLLKPYLAENLRQAATMLRDHARIVAERDREIARLRTECRLKTVAIDRWAPCPDHRDKTERGVCQCCVRERAERKAEAAAQRAEALEGQVAAARDLAEQWNTDARAEGFGGGAVKARDLLDAMDAAAPLTPEVRHG